MVISKSEKEYIIEHMWLLPSDNYQLYSHVTCKHKDHKYHTKYATPTFRKISRII